MYFDAFFKISAIEPAHLNHAFIAWVNEVRALTSQPLIAIDGKTLRHSYEGDKMSALHSITALCGKKRYKRMGGLNAAHIHNIECRVGYWLNEIGQTLKVSLKLKESESFNLQVKRAQERFIMQAP